MTDKDKKLNTEESIDKSQFEFVQKEDKIYDKKFQTKPIGYFKDAMIRFAKNKTNVIATTILALLIILSILVPTFSPKADAIDNNTQESQIAHLPPRIPILENLGIADGTAYYEDVPASYNNPYVDEDGNQIYDSEGNPLYLPSNEFSEFIIDGELKNYYLTCTDREESCEGGTVQFAKQFRDKPMAAYSTIPEVIINTEGLEETVYTNQVVSSIFSPDYVTLEIDIDEESSLNENVIDGSASFKIYFQIIEDGVVVSDRQMVLVLDTSDSATYDSYDEDTGVFTVDLVDHPDLAYNTEKYQVLVSYQSDVLDSGVLDSVKLSAGSGAFEYGNQGPDENYLIYAEGFRLSKFKLATDILTDDGEGNTELMYNGNVLRIDGQRLNASYTVDAYGRAFGPVFKFEQGTVFAELSQSCTYLDGTPFDINNPVPGRFNPECAYYELIERNDEDAVIVPGKGTFYTYDVFINYTIYEGYDEIPYFLFGTSAAGYDMVNLIWIGLRTSLLIGLFVSAINIAIGVVYGAISGYYGGQVDIIMQRFAEIIGRIPWLVTLSIFMAYFQAGFTSLILILIVSGWIGVSSVTRTQFYRYKGREYVLASRTLGAKDGRLIFRHILPNGIGTIITSSILLIPTVIFSEATLSYLGFGIGHGQSLNILGWELSGVSIGVLLNDGRNKLQNYPHLTIFPAIIISILMITFNMFGNALRDAFNPALRGSE